jgi:hypothetical protein
VAPRGQPPRALGDRLPQRTEAAHLQGDRRQGLDADTHGEFFVEENVRLPGNRPGAPFALATSARSEVFQEFEGGPGQIALHGLSNVGGSLGTAMSHGCVRMANRSIIWLAKRIKPGDPVTIV